MYTEWKLVLHLMYSKRRRGGIWQWRDNRTQVDTNTATQRRREVGTSGEWLPGTTQTNDAQGAWGSTTASFLRS